MDGEEVVMQQYPSPNVDAQDSGVYDRDQDLEQLREHLQEPPTPQRGIQRPSVSAEELQLAAQLTEGLATQGFGPSLPTGTANQEARIEPQDPELETLHSLQTQDPSLQNQDPSLQQVMTQTETAQQSYIETPTPPTHLPQHQHVQISVAQTYGVVDNTPPRKRSKVSRACDECRRKKVKCDASSENGEEPCSNCRRSGIRCLFSRVPQKRGPSKGYIKELADRIHHIEGKLGGQSVSEALGLAGLPRRESSGGFSPAIPGDESSRKRPFSSISGDGFSTPSNNRQTAWGSEPRPIQPYQTPSDRYRTSSYSANGLGPQPIAPRPDGSRPAAMMDGLSADAQEEQGRDVDDGIFHGYLSIIHHTFPLLPAVKSRLQEQLGQCSLLLREAFIEALNATMKSFAVPNAEGDSRAANRLLGDWEAETAERSTVSDLIHLQTLILMIIEADNHGPASLKGQHPGPSKSSLIGRAVGVAYSLSLQRSHIDSSIDVQPELDTDHVLGIRAWWILVIIDRWNAIGTADPMMIPNDTVTLSAGLKLVFGEAIYRFIMLSYIIGHWLPASLTAPESLGPGSGAAASAAFNVNMEMWRADFPPDITPADFPVVHLAYWHCRLLAYLFMPSALATDIVWASKELVRLLVENPSLLSPLSHHFTCLASLSLLELTKVEKTREEATQLLKQILESHIAPSSWDSSIRDKIAETVRPSTSSGAEVQGLQHLADLAAATEVSTGAAPEIKTDDVPKFRTSDTYDDLGFDPRPMLRAGYLNALNLATS